MYTNWYTLLVIRIFEYEFIQIAPPLAKAPPPLLLMLLTPDASFSRPDRSGIVASYTRRMLAVRAYRRLTVTVVMETTNRAVVQRPVEREVLPPAACPLHDRNNARPSHYNLAARVCLVTTLAGATAFNFLLPLHDRNESPPLPVTDVDILVPATGR